MHISSPCISSVGVPATSTTISFREERRAGGFGEARAEEEVAVADDDAHRNAGVGDAAQRGRDAGRHRLAQLVVADPLVEEVAEHVQAGGRARRSGAERFERRHERRSRRRQVEVGDEQRRLYATSSARWRTTSSVGTFWWKPLLAVFTPLILSTTSCPAVTLPKTQ